MRFPMVTSVEGACRLRPGLARESRPSGRHIPNLRGRNRHDPGGITPQTRYTAWPRARQGEEAGLSCRVGRGWAAVARTALGTRDLERDGGGWQQAWLAAAARAAGEVALAAQHDVDGARSRLPPARRGG